MIVNLSAKEFKSEVLYKDGPVCSDVCIEFGRVETVSNSGFTCEDKHYSLEENADVSIGDLVAKVIIVRLPDVWTSRVIKISNHLDSASLSYALEQMGLSRLSQKDILFTEQEIEFLFTGPDCKEYIEIEYDQLYITQAGISALEKRFGESKYTFEEYNPNYQKYSTLERYLLMQFKAQGLYGINGKIVPVYIPNHLSRDQRNLIFTSFHMRDMADRTDSRFTITKLEILATFVVGGKKMLFMMFNADVVDPDGNFIPGVVFSRGGSVAILFEIFSGGKSYALLVKQPRFPIGEFDSYELPAGMLDGSGNFAGVMAKEIEEETGITVNIKDLLNMTHMVYGENVKGFYPSQGGCDEFITIFYKKVHWEPSQLEEIQGRIAGAADENEKVQVNMVPFEDLVISTPDGKTLAAVALHDTLEKKSPLWKTRNKYQ